MQARRRCSKTGLPFLVLCLLRLLPHFVQSTGGIAHPNLEEGYRPLHTRRRTNTRKKGSFCIFSIIAIATVTTFIDNNNGGLKKHKAVNSLICGHVICYCLSCFVFYRHTSFIVGYRCCVFYKFKAGPSTSEKITTGFIASSRLERKPQHLRGMPVLLLFYLLYILSP